MSLKKRAELSTLGRYVVGKFPVISMKCRETNQIIAFSAEHIDSETFHEFITAHTTDDSLIYTDEVRSCPGIPREHQGNMNMSRMICIRMVL